MVIKQRLISVYL